MRKDAYLERLQKVPMFEALSRKELGGLAKLAETIDVKEGTALVKEGTTGREFFVISEGTAKVVRGRKKVATLKAGDYFGELSLLDGSPRNASVIAETAMTLIVLGQREFLGELHESPTIAYKLLKGMARRLRELDSKSQ